MTYPTGAILTIGHSTQVIGAFTDLLQRHRVAAVVDVRSVPYSRFNPQFNREPLQKSLAASDVAYHFLGRELGARSDDPACYEAGRVQYSRLARTKLFLDGIDHVVRIAAVERVALMCAEKEPLECHRTLLVARALVERGSAVGHILGSGNVESHETAMERLLDVVGLPREDLFRSRESLLEEALVLQESRIAYVRDAGGLKPATEWA